jgi:hypothetical protein
MGNKIGSGCEGDKRTYLLSISSALSVNSAVKIRNGGDGENSRVFGGIHGRGI